MSFKEAVCLLEIPEKEIKENKIVIKFQSPLCTRERNQNKDYYYSFENEKFEIIPVEKMKINKKIKIFI